MLLVLLYFVVLCAAATLYIYYLLYGSQSKISYIERQAGCIMPAESYILENRTVSLTASFAVVLIVQPLPGEKLFGEFKMLVHGQNTMDGAGQLVQLHPSAIRDLCLSL
jgi:hypothetical protein